ncbi:MAG TPA: TRAP transporter large permease subunit [Casimicrobiaceae bacterium]|nr:TRAP transporter large permease subunit [Casimicrobiaceae bacterium]
MDAAGILMLLVVGGVMIVTGLPTWLVLIGTAAAFAAIGVMIHALPLALLASAPSRLIGLLENDLLQALPLYVLMGALLNRLPMAQTLFRVLTRVLGRSGKGAPVAALALGAVFAPMNGSVGASVVMLGRTVAPRLASSGLTQARGGAVIAMASTLGVVIPPSLVLILLGDAMLRAHTEAVNITGRAARIINTQDVFRGALVPAAAILVLALVITWWRSGASTRDAEAVDLRLRPSEAVTALAVIGGIIALLAAVTLGYVYAVEAAAAGGVALFAYGVATRSIGAAMLRDVLRDTMAVTGALFALLVAATMFTLVLRGFGTDRLLARGLTEMGGGTYAPLAATLVALAACAFVLDAFEMIFVVIPVLVPPVLVRVPDPVWVAVLVLLILQASFLVPPFGYAVLMVRNVLRLRTRVAELVPALLPYLVAQLIVMAAVLAAPGLLWRPGMTEAPGASTPAVSDDEAREMMERQLAPPMPEEPSN